MVLRVVPCRRIGIHGRLGEDGFWIRSVTEGAGASEYVGEGVPRDIDLNTAQLVGRHRDVDVAGIGGYSLDRTALAPKVADDDAGLGSVILGDFGNSRSGDVLITRVGHLQV